MQRNGTDFMLNRLIDRLMPEASGEQEPRARLLITMVMMLTVTTTVFLVFGSIVTIAGDFEPSRFISELIVPTLGIFVSSPTPSGTLVRVALTEVAIIPAVTLSTPEL